MGYTCWTGFDAETEGLATEVDEACIDFDSTLQGVRSCPGEPSHADFFAKTPYNYLFNAWREVAHTFSYVKRHRVLFNLYAFDPIRSNATHAPTLNLINCDFKYFLDKQALIQVETNNFIEMGIIPSADG